MPISPISSPACWRDCGARLIVLHVAGMHVDVPKPIHTELGIAFDCSGDHKSHHDSLKARLHEQFEKNPKIHVETRLIYGDATEEILRTANEVDCNLIVMGTHGRTGLGRLLMGSVAEAVLSRARCPVMTVKSPDETRNLKAARREHEAATA